MWLHILPRFQYSSMQLRQQERTKEEKSGMKNEFQQSNDSNSLGHPAPEGKTKLVDFFYNFNHALYVSKIDYCTSFFISLRSYNSIMKLPNVMSQTRREMQNNHQNSKKRKLTFSYLTRQCSNSVD